MKSNTLTKSSLDKDYSCLWYRISNQLMHTSPNTLLQASTPETKKPYPQPNPNSQAITYKWYRSVEEMTNIWSELNIKDVFLQKTYLKMLETYTPEGMRFVYWVFYKGEQPVGFLYGQIQRFNVYNSINNLHQTPKGNMWQRFKHSTRKSIAKRVNIDILFLGNLLVTGEHGLHFDEKSIENVDLVKLIESTVEETLKTIGEKKVRVTYFKEYFEDKSAIFDNLKDYNYKPISTEPNMIFHVRPEWETFDDYLQAMSSKYRVRAKRAFKKSKGIEKRELSLEEIDKWNDRIFELYQGTASKAEFNALFLNERYFYGLKALLKEDFQLFGYFLDGEMIGFYTLIYSDKEIDAHFLGLDGRFNSKHQVYLNMLYDMIRIGIDRRASEIIMARTAMEIKSSVGAVPHEMYSYLKIKNALLNNQFPNYSDSFAKPTEWTPRQPFK